MRRILPMLATAVAVTVALSACVFIPQSSEESGNGMTETFNDALGEAITATSPNIDFTYISVELDGLTHLLYVRPALTSAGLTSSELDAVLKVAYTESLGEVETIQVRTVDSSNKPLDVEAAATELGIHFVSHVNSVSYSTEFLKDAYGE